MTYTATYSPEDNKLRLSASSRLDAETYARVKAAGFHWAPRQEIFVAPMWTPERESLCLELAGEIDDEDTSLVERAEARADRFGDYSQSRAADAESARAHVDAIADGIPMGQPILIGHHSERHARRDAQKIENGMRRAVKMWETSQYWKSRAAGAIRAAKYKELPAVRARRIKTIEADHRKCLKLKDEAEKLLRFWSRPDISRESALQVCNYLDRGGFVLASGQVEWSAWSALEHNTATVEEIRAQRVDRIPKQLAVLDHWLLHHANRLEYERAMLAESGGTVADRNKPEKGGSCRCWASPRGGWSTIQKVNRISVTVLDNWGNGGRNFTRVIPFDKLQGVMSVAEIATARTEGRIMDDPAGLGFFLADTPPERPAPVPPTPEAEQFGAMRESLRAGVQVVSVPQLFPTPPDLAARMVKLADIGPGEDVLEPSAGTGRILDACFHLNVSGRLAAVEINPHLARVLAERYPLADIRAADFLTCNGDLGKFDVILMNPPFGDAHDIRHIQHALTMLRPGGRLVAICANGPRQQERLKPLATCWQPLPPDTFRGTSVNAALMFVEAPKLKIEDSLRVAQEYFYWEVSR